MKENYLHKKLKIGLVLGLVLIGASIESNAQEWTNKGYYNQAAGRVYTPAEDLYILSTDPGDRTAKDRDGVLEVYEYDIAGSAPDLNSDLEAGCMGVLETTVTDTGGGNQRGYDTKNADLYTDNEIYQYAGLRYNGGINGDRGNNAWRRFTVNFSSAGDWYFIYRGGTAGSRISGTKFDVKILEKADISNVISSISVDMTSKTFTDFETAGKGGVVSNVGIMETSTDLIDGGPETAWFKVLDGLSIPSAGEYVMEFRIHEDVVNANSFLGSLALDKSEFDLPQVAPNINPQSFTVKKTVPNGTVVGTVVATDINEDPITFSIEAGNDAGIFAIDASTGELTIADRTNLPASDLYELTVAASDGMASSNAIITIEAGNNAPTIAAQTFSIIEDEEVGDELGTVIASDEDGEILTYSIAAGNEAGIFAIDAASGILTIAKAELVYADQSQYVITVTVDDGNVNNSSSSADITIDVIEFNFTPSISDQNFMVEAGAPVGTEIGRVIASDQNAGDVLTYSILAGNNTGAFAIDENSGVVTVVDEDALWTYNEYILVVQVDDSREVDNTATANITIQLDLSNVLASEVINKNDLLVYPNPTAGQLNLVLSKEMIGAQISITNLSGKLVRNFKVMGTQQQLDLNSIQAGIYMVRIENENLTLTRKFIKQN
ncbi:cadherin domain-containing protein [Reichenbachiella ulvae]|uniref:Cadherin domain-containing protein n=1 Tax=Reichenbachiella ulvae TaxID=2980104 RepID=A0ABT3D0E7_9BACT|nr:cadherin domain-containing protein [Reichenbachiella ulvae]MCV9389273.1 cadherin domain-containing protein [Reichenbachiella ulvae]